MAVLVAGVVLWWSLGRPAPHLGGHAAPPGQISFGERTVPAPQTNQVWYHRGSSDLTVVFLHGILSDSRSCWLSARNDDFVYWPELVVADSTFGDASVYLAGYY
ncbi:MAG: hypothetical protein HKN12_06565, partial [Gemmatimonadetes bacterium]|nr:hypothetical protein [Gemmatimonadota bacterium]